MIATKNGTRIGSHLHSQDGRWPQDLGCSWRTGPHQAWAASGSCPARRNQNGETLRPEEEQILKHFRSDSK